MYKIMFPIMKKILISLLAFISFGLLANKAYAYTTDDIAQHNTEDDCWMIYDGSVYDLTSYLDIHDRFLDIRNWCGSDMTEAFETKDGLDRDHRSSSYALLENYKIGEISSDAVVNEDQEEEKEIEADDLISIEEVETEETKTSNPYNLWLPILLTLVFYWGSYFIMGKKDICSFNGFWNTILLLTLVIPSLGFGIFMILRYSLPGLWNIDFDFMYWHVELSLVMGILGISHLIQRFGVYKLQLKRKNV